MQNIVPEQKILFQNKRKLLDLCDDLTASHIATLNIFFETWQSHYLSDKSSATITWTSLGTELVISASPSTHSEPKAAKA